MGTFISILLDILSILAIVIFGAFVVVIIADLILCCFDGHQGIIFNRSKKDDKKEEKKDERKSEVKKDDIVVYTDKQNPNKVVLEEDDESQDEIDGDKIQEIDYDKAVEEQKALQAKTRPAPAPAPAKKAEAPKKVEKAPSNDDLFWDDNEDEEFNKMLDSVIAEAKKGGAPKEKKEAPVVAQEKADDKKDNALSAETQKELEELKSIKAQQEKELEEFKKLKEDFAREKEEQIAQYKENLDKTKQEEIEKLRQEALKEQERLDKMREDLEKEQEKLEEAQAKLKEEAKLAKENKEETKPEEQIVQQTVIKDEEEINKLKYKNLVRMNNRLTRIIRDTEKLTAQKQKEMERIQAEKEKMLEKERLERIKEQERQLEIEKQQRIERERLERLKQEEKQREQERLNEIKRQNQERLLKQQEEIRKRNEIAKMYSEASKREGKYKLNSKVVTITKEDAPIEERIIEETITTTTQTIPHSNTQITTVEKTPLKSTAKPLFEKEYYEAKLNELDEELREAEKELRLNKTEYIPLTRIHKAYERDSEKLRKKEMQVAKQKVALYGVSGSKVDPEKKAKLDENLQSLSELKDSVAHCEEVIRKNKDRYPVLEKNHQLITKQINRINEDMKVCEKAISYYNKKKD